MLAQRQTPTIITRKARFWPEIPHDSVQLPASPSDPSGASSLTIITMLLSVAGLAVSGFIFSRIGGGSSLFVLAFIAMGAFAAIGSLITFFIQSANAKRERTYLLALYKQRLLAAETRLRALQLKEQQAHVDLAPPFVPPQQLTDAYNGLNVTSLVQRGTNEQDMLLWTRRPDDPDFLSVRIGMGSHSTTYTVSGEQSKEKIQLPTFFDAQDVYAAALLEKYSTLVAPITLKIHEHGPIAITSTPNVYGLNNARELARVLVSQLAYHHSPEDVRIIILTPESQSNAWQWATLLPHTRVFDDSSGITDVHVATALPAVAIGPEAVVEQLPRISRELGRRELLLGDKRHASDAPTLLPHLLIVVDHFDLAGDLDPPPLAMPLMNFKAASVQVNNRSRLTVSPLKRAEMTLALSRGTQLGVSVICVCPDKTDVPTTCGLTIDLDVASYPNLAGTTQIELPNLEETAKERKQRLKKQEPAIHKQTLQPQACVRVLRPDPPSLQVCDMLDNAPLDALRHFALKMQFLQPAITKRVELRTQVDLRMLFEPALDIAAYDPLKLWLDPAYRTYIPSASSGVQNGRTGQKAVSAPLLRIPIGQKIGDEVQYLDLIKDGPHGLLIGQTGSGKSELLQTIIMSLALLYKPTEATFLLIDYKAGLALEPFRSLPHTISFLSNVSSPALIQRFITMLRAEALRRERRLKAGQFMPRLIIVIDEFAEMAKRTETVLDELFTITRVGREIGMHLLLSAQRPEGIIGTKVRDYVQYRLCLRCASPDDSREVLGRVDAANLPASIPGRGFLLHGDNQLDLFQAARTTISAPM